MANRAGTKAPDPQAENGHDPDHNAPPVENAAGADIPTAEPQLALASDDREALLVSHMAQARLHNKALEAAQEVVRGVRKARNRHRNLARADGFTLKILDEVLADEVRDRLELEDEAEMRTFMRNTAHLPVIGRAQLDLFAGVNQAPARPTGNANEDEAYWTTEGFRVGFRGGDGEVPEGTPPGMATQAWTAGWQSAQAELGKKLQRAEAINEGRLEE